MTLVRTTVLNGVATLVRMGTALAINKVLAAYVGPAGYALVGQFSNVVTIANSAAGGALAPGITKLTAQHFDDEARQRAMLRTATRHVFGMTLLTSISLILLSDHLARGLLGGQEHQSVIVLLGCVLPLITANSLLLAVLNGKKAVTRYVVQNISASLLGAAISAALAITHGVQGALAALALNQSIVVFVTLWLCRRQTWFRADAFLGNGDRDSAHELRGFALMALVSALVAPLGQIAVRNLLITHFDHTVAGQWQATFKISEIYLMLFTATLSVYYLPRLAEIKDRVSLYQEIRKVYALILPAAAVMAAAIYCFRHWIAVTLFSPEFEPMERFFGWQLLGDVLKIGSWILSFVMVGRGMVGWFVATELIFGCSWPLLTWVLVGILGEHGATAGFALNYGFYWLFMIWLIRREAAGWKS